MTVYVPPPQLVLLRAMAHTGKPVVRHRSGWVLSNGTHSCPDGWVKALIEKGLIETIPGTIQAKLTDAGQEAAQGAP